MPSRMPFYTNIPSPANGYPISGIWEVIKPTARINEVLNPSFETNLTGYTAGAGTLVRSTTKQYHGTYSGQYTPSAALTDGFFYSFSTNWTAAQFRAVSCKFWGQPNVPYVLSVNTNVGVELQAYKFRGKGRWQWIWLYWIETSTTNRRIYFRKDNSVDTHPFYVDGVQSEVINTGEFVSTYIDGDQSGFLTNQFPLPYGWNGTPHASTSYRSALTSAGGQVIPFSRFGFLLASVLGLGLATPKNVTTEYSRIDGGFSNYTRKPVSTFSILGNMSEGSYPALRRARSSLGQLLDRDATALDQKILLRYRHANDCDEDESDAITIPCRYVSGLDGLSDNQFAQNIPLTFEQYLPAISLEMESGSALSVQQSVANANYIIKRSASGTWSALGTGGTANTNVITVGADGKVYAGNGGTFGGVANTNRIAYFDPTDSAWHAMGTGSSTGGADAVTGIVIAPNGTDIIVMGTNTSFGGVANTANLGKWNGSAWSSITPLGSANGTVFNGVYDSAGNLYVVGSFTSINGVAANRVAKMTPAGVWSALSTGLNGTAECITVDAQDNVYIGGDFTTPFTRATKWNGSAFSALGSGFDSTVWVLKFDSAQRLYAAGSFTASGTTPLTAFALWNGVYWSALDGGLAGGTNVFALADVPSLGFMYLAGAFTSAGGVNTPDSLATWNGATYLYPSVDLPGSAVINALALTLTGDLYVGFSTNGSATAEASATVNNPGSAWAYPTVTIRGPSSGSSRIFSVRNITTGRSIYIDGSINAGEVWTLNFQPDLLSFTSTFAPNAPQIVPGSNTAEFFLERGDNVIAFHSANSTVTAVLSFHPAYTSLDDLQ